MMDRIIEMVVSPTGETALPTKGFTGGDCQQASKRLETAFGTNHKDQLQWVHGRITVVMGQNLHFTGLLYFHPSMGPRSDDRGYGA